MWHKRREEAGSETKAAIVALHVGLGTAVAAFMLTGAQPQWAIATSAVSSSGTIFYVNDVDGDGGTSLPRIFKVNADGSGWTPLTPASQQASAPRPSPDGRRITYVIEEGPLAKWPTFLADTDGSNRRRLRNGYFSGWSPDSQSYALAGGRPRGIHIVDSRGAVRRLTRGPDSVWAWSRSGRIAFRRGDALISISSAGGGWKKILGNGPHRKMQGEFVLSPDWKKALVTDEVNEEFFLLDLRTNTMRKLVDRYFARQLAWSPDGKTFLFQGSAGARGCALYIANADGSGQRMIPGTGSCPSSPTWSPDGTRIAYTRNVVVRPKPKWEIWTMRRDGSDQRRIAPRGSLWDLVWTR